MGTALIVEGKLRGMGCDVECSLMATRSEIGDEANVMFSKCTVLEAPPWLPDGYYEVTFCGQSAFLHRVNSVWSVGVPWRYGQVGLAGRGSVMTEPIPEA